MSTAHMTPFMQIARAGVVAVTLALLAACTTTNLESNGVSSHGAAANAGGQTNDPAAGFANVQPGSEEDFILNVGRRTYFAKGSAAIDDTARVTLDNQIAFLTKYPRWYAKIQGFADDPGGDAAMVALSAKRADAVMNYLAAGGISRQRMWAKGYGKERIVRDCTDKACQVQNRRVITNLRDSREE